MKNKTEIKKMILTIGKTDVEVSLDQARELQGVLNDLFGAPTTVIVNPNPSPIVIEKQVPYWNSPVVTWDGGTGNQVEYSVDQGALHATI